MSWRCYIDDRPFPYGRLRIVVARPLGDGRTELVLRSGARHVIAENTTPDDDLEVGFEIPADALDALRLAIDEKLGRRYDEALVDEVRSALYTERERVDRVLERLLLEAALRTDGHG